MSFGDPDFMLGIPSRWIFGYGSYYRCININGGSTSPCVFGDPDSMLGMARGWIFGYVSYHHCININSSSPGQDGRHFADNIFKCIFLNENVWISIKISLKFVPGCRINNIPALVQIIAWRRPGDKPLSEPMMVLLLMHICVTQHQWVKY